MEPRVLFLGIDAIADNLRDASRRASENSLYGLLALEDAPGELAGFADRLTVLFPWGSLLRALFVPELDGLARLRAICRPQADVRFLFELDSDPGALERRYLEAGFAVTGTPMPIDAARALPTTWAKKLGFSGRPRRFCELRGRAIGRTSPAEGVPDGHSS